MIKLVAKSDNAKTGNVAASYRMVGKTCPITCALLNAGCYAQQSFVNIHQKQADFSVIDGQALVDFVQTLPKGKVFRHHVSGDVFIDNAPDYTYIQAMNDAANARPDMVFYGYTHGWKQMNATDFNAPNLGINASCDTKDDVLEALAKGWNAVTVIGVDETRKTWDEGEFVVQVCPNQLTEGANQITCVMCQLCARVKPNHIERNNKPVVVAFKAHGNARNKITERVNEDGV